MNLKKLIAGFFLCIICAATIGGVSVNAKSKKIKLVPETKNETFELLFVDVIVSLKPSDIQKIEYQNGKVKKTSDKYWSNACELEYFYEGSKKNTTEVSLNVYYNDTYSVRVTTKSGKKYVNYIKIKNLGVPSENCLHTYSITDVSEPDSNGNYTVTVECKTELNATYSDFEGTKVGDTVYIDEKPVIIQEFRVMDTSGKTKSQNKWDESVGLIVVVPKNFSDFYEGESLKFIEEYPEYADFGFITGDYDNEYIAYDDYEYWEAEGYYVALYKVLSTKKFKVTKDTNVKLAYSEKRFISGKDYFAVYRGDKTIDGINVYKGLDYRLYEKYTKKDGFTDVISELVEIYTP